MIQSHLLDTLFIEITTDEANNPKSSFQKFFPSFLTLYPLLETEMGLHRGSSIEGLPLSFFFLKT